MQSKHSEEGLCTTVFCSHGNTLGGDCIAVYSALKQRTAVPWLQTPMAAPPLQEGSAGVGGRPGGGL